MVVIETPETEERVARTQKRASIFNRSVLYTFAVPKKMLPPLEGCSQSPQKLLTVWYKAVVTEPRFSSPPTPLPRIILPNPTSIPACSKPIPSKVLGKPAEQRDPGQRRASDHHTPHPWRRCLETVPIPPTSLRAALCIGAH